MKHEDVQGSVDRSRIVFLLALVVGVVFFAGIMTFRRLTPGMQPPSDSAASAARKPIDLSTTQKRERPKEWAYGSSRTLGRDAFSQRSWDPDRLDRDSSYRAMVVDFWISRNLELSRRAGAVEIEALFELFGRYGIERGMASQFVRMAYEDLTEIDRFGKFGNGVLSAKHQWDEEVSARRSAGILVTMEEQQSAERHYVATYNHWISMSEGLKIASTKSLMRDTGIADPLFFRQLFEIQITIPAGPVDTSMAEGELPSVH